MKKYVLIISVFIAFSSCDKENGPQQDLTTPPENLTGGVIVLNEGLFNANNASLTYRDQKGNLSQNVFQSINNRSMGDVLQSYAQTESSIYLVLNNSGKIEKISRASLTSELVMNGFSSPRYMLPLEDGKTAWVSNLMLDSSENEIDVVNLETGVIKTSIPVMGWCEQMIRDGSTIYIANTGSNQLIVTNGIKVNRVDLPPQPIDLVQDANGSIWILCTGGFSGGRAALCKFNPVNQKVESILRFSNPFAYPSKLTINSDGTMLYFLEGGLYKMNITDPEIPSEPLIEASANGYFYGLGVQPGSDQIYVGDAKDFQSHGEVHVYSKDGVYLESFDAGYLPSGFIFR